MESKQTETIVRRALFRKWDDIFDWRTLIENRVNENGFYFAGENEFSLVPVLASSTRRSCEMRDSFAFSLSLYEMGFSPPRDENSLGNRWMNENVLQRRYIFSRQIGMRCRNSNLSQCVTNVTRRECLIYAINFCFCLHTSERVVNIIEMVLGQCDDCAAAAPWWANAFASHTFHLSCGVRSSLFPRYGLSFHRINNNWKR